MLFWFTTVAQYLFTGLVALVLSVVISFLIILPFGGADSPKGLAVLGFLVFVPVTSLLVPLCLGITAELIARKVSVRRFKWSKALMRSLLALPIRRRTCVRRSMRVSLRRDLSPKTLRWKRSLSLHVVLRLCVPCLAHQKAASATRSLGEGRDACFRQPRRR